VLEIAGDGTHISVVIEALDLEIVMATDPNSLVAGKTIFHLRDINNSNLYWLICAL